MQLPDPPPSPAILEKLATLLVLAAFAVLLVAHAAEPSSLVFDETHYVPAAKALAHLADDLNWEHPPLSKWILGLGGVVGERLHLGSELATYRLVTAAFGLWALASVAGFLRDLRLAGWAIPFAVALTGMNVLWFVQSRTAMPDVFSLAFALAGLRRVRRSDAGPGSWWGWAELGLGMACKWSAAPFCVLAVFWARAPARRRAAGVLVAVVAYAVPFLPLALLARHATPAADLLVGYQLRMLEGFGRVDLATHPYGSRPWQWPTLLRPAWYHFEQGAAGDRYVWAGGNPLLYACALPATLWLAARALRRRAAEAERALAILYFAPLAFWAALPRTQLYYYFLPSSLWLGPAVVWAALRLAGSRRRVAQVGVALVTAACALVFAWFSPLLDGRLEPRNAYDQLMWLGRWR